MIGIVVPMEKEAAGLAAFLSGRKRSLAGGGRVTLGRIGKAECAVTVTGCGKVLSSCGTQALIDRLLQVFLRSAPGFCRGAFGGLKIGDFIIGEELIEHDYYSRFGGVESAPRSCCDLKLAEAALCSARKSGHRAFKGKIISGNEDIVTARRRDELLSKYGALSADWESFACAKVCNIAKVPVLVMRVIADYAYEDTHLEFSENVEDVSRRLCAFAAGFIGARFFK